MLYPVPWNDEATLTLRSPGEELPRIVLTGSLRAVLALIDGAALPERARMIVSFADRGSAPFEYRPEHFAELIGRARLQG